MEEPKIVRNTIAFAAVFSAVLLGTLLPTAAGQSHTDCVVRIRPPEPAPGLLLGLHEVQLYNGLGGKMDPGILSAAMSSVWSGQGPYTVQQCIDDVTTSTFNPQKNFWSNLCHTAPNDPQPTVAVTYPCSHGVSKVVIYNFQQDGKTHPTGLTLNRFNLEILKGDTVVFSQALSNAPVQEVSPRPVCITIICPVRANECTSISTCVDRPDTGVCTTLEPLANGLKCTQSNGQEGICSFGNCNAPGTPTTQPTSEGTSQTNPSPNPSPPVQDAKDPCNCRGLFLNGECKCIKPYTGPSCETENPCANVDCGRGAGYVQNGKCKCACMKGYKGEKCGEQDKCAFIQCNNGICIDGKCSCLPGNDMCKTPPYTGSICNEVNCPDGTKYDPITKTCPKCPPNFTSKGGPNAQCIPECGCDKTLHNYAITIENCIPAIKRIEPVPVEQASKA